MKEKVYANYKIKKPRNIFLGFIIFAIINFILGVSSIWLENFKGDGFYLPALLFLVLALSYRDQYFYNIQTPIIYFNIDEIIVNYRSALIISQEEIERFEIKKKRILKIFLKDKRPVSISLYHLTYQKIDYVEAKLNEFIKK